MESGATINAGAGLHNHPSGQVTGGQGALGGMLAGVFVRSVGMPLNTRRIVAVQAFSDGGQPRQE